MRKKMSEQEQTLARRLRDAGIPLELDEDGSDCIHPAGPGLLIHQVGAVIGSTAFDLDGGGTGYMLDLEIASNVPGLVVVRYFALDLPWHDPQFLWLPDPADSGAKWDMYGFPGTKIEYPRNMVINHRTGLRGELRRGEILDGLLLGMGFESIPDCFRHGASVDGTLSIVDQFGRSHSSQISLWINRSVTIDRARRKAMPAWLRSRRRLLEKVDAL